MEDRRLLFQTPTLLLCSSFSTHHSHETQSDLICPSEHPKCTDGPVDWEETERGIQGKVERRGQRKKKRKRRGRKRGHSLWEAWTEELCDSPNLFWIAAAKENRRPSERHKKDNRGENEEVSDHPVLHRCPSVALFFRLPLAIQRLSVGPPDLAGAPGVIRSHL